MDQNCKIPSVSMGAVCNPCAVQVTSKLTLVYLEVGHLAILLMLWIFVVVVGFSLFVWLAFFLQIITYIMHGLIVAVWFTCKLLSGSHV